MRTVATVIGHFGFGIESLDGQTVKTKNITAELERRYGVAEIQKIDTHGGIRTLLKAPAQVCKALSSSQNVIILPAHNGIRVYIPLLKWMGSFYKHVKIHYVVIGGWLPEFLQKHPHLAKQLKRIDGIYVETRTMKTALEQQGFRNIYILPNFKSLHILDESELVYCTEEPLKLCTFSRVMREKGIEDALDAVKAVNEHYGRTVYSLDIYGQIDAGQTEWFANLRESFPDYVQYRGVVPFGQSVETLKDYFALLFPTFYDGEGFAGTLIDSFSAGVPVVSSDWRYNAELVDEGKTGTLFALRDVVGCASKLSYIAEHIDEWNQMKSHCIEKANEYRPERAIEMLYNRL